LHKASQEHENTTNMKKEYIKCKNNLKKGSNDKAEINYKKINNV